MGARKGGAVLRCSQHPLTRPPAQLAAGTAVEIPSVGVFALRAYGKGVQLPQFGVSATPRAGCLHFSHR